MLALEDIKFNSENLPEGWMLINELFVSSEELPLFETKFGAKIENIVNQFISTKEANVQVNYILCPDLENAKLANQKMIELVGYINTVLSKENIVVEIITDEIKLKEEIISILNEGRKDK